MTFRDLLLHNRSILLAWSLVLLTHLGTEIVIADSKNNIAMIAIKFIIGVLLSGGLLWRTISNNKVANHLVGLTGIIAMGSPMLIEPIWRSLGGVGHAFEIQLLIGFRNLSLTILAWAIIPRMERLAVVTSLFALLFCVSTSQDQSMAIVSGSYLLIGIAWLTNNYWSALKTDRVLDEQRSAPVTLLVTLSIIVLLALSVMAIPNSVRTRMVEGFMPSSGGTGQYDSAARSGVGDGDALVAGTTKALTFAPIEDAPFIEGKQPSLYDIIQDTYGPPKPPEKQQRAISLSLDQAQLNHHRMAQAKKSSRSFSMRRGDLKSTHRHVDDTETKAMLHLVGRVPLHLRHTAYDLFDGQEWYPEIVRKEHKLEIRVEEVDEKPWITWNMPKGHSIFHNVEPHALRIVNIQTNHILSPENTIGVHIDRCDRIDMFSWVHEDLLRMNRDTLPNLTVIQLQSQLVDELKLNGRLRHIQSRRGVYSEYPEEGKSWERIHQLALEWTRDAETVWEKAQAIRDRLKENYVLNRELNVPDSAENPIAWFLFDSRQGSDYLFASSATMLMRSIGIPSRVVSGFYAHPDHFDAITRQTPVYKEDIHWWAEISIGTRYWHVIEATPGYEVLQPSRTIFARIALAAIWTFQLAIQHWPITLVFFLSCITAFIYRNRILARWITWRWLLGQWTTEKQEYLRPLLLKTLASWDRKLTLAGKPRPSSHTVSRHLDEIGRANSEVSEEEWNKLVKLSDWAMYGLNDRPPTTIDPPHLKKMCKELLNRTRVTREKKTQAS